LKVSEAALPARGWLREIHAAQNAFAKKDLLHAPEFFRRNLAQFSAIHLGHPSVLHFVRKVGLRLQPLSIINYPLSICFNLSKNRAPTGRATLPYRNTV